MKQSAQTPATLFITPGHYDLVLRIPGYEPWVGDVQVKENSQATLNVELKELPQGHFAWADVSTTPEGAEILIDGTPTGRVSPARVQVSAGTHVIALRLSGFVVARRGVEASEGATVTLSETLQPK
jgi:hypothetical protein